MQKRKTHCSNEATTVSATKMLS